MSTAYDNNLYQLSSLSPDPDQADNVFAARYNAAYSSQPNTPSSAQHMQPAANVNHGLYKGLGTCSIARLQHARHSCALRPCVGAHNTNAEEQAFGEATSMFMAGENIQTTLQHFAASCLEHSRDLK